MANDLNANPLRIDTVMTAGSGKPITLRVTRVRVTGVTTAGALTIVEATSGKTLLQAQCPVGDTDVLWSIPQLFPKSSDWKVTAIPTGGVVFIFHD
jgi:hypothetical protein